MGLSKFNIWGKDAEDNSGEDYYNVTPEDAVNTGTGNKVILSEPRAYSESQQIADHLKNRNSVLVNLKRVTSDQAKRIIDFLSGTLYAIGGDLQKVGGGIYLCTPKNINVQGQISEENGKDKDDDTMVEW